MARLFPRFFPAFWRSRGGLALLVFLGVAGFLLVYEHRAHIPGDYLLLGGLLLACLLFHGLMHGGGHGGGSDGGGQAGEGARGAGEAGHGRAG